jgi:hypothetical protein
VAVCAADTVASNVVMRGRFYRMSRKSGNRFSGKDMRKSQHVLEKWEPVFR